MTDLVFNTVRVSQEGEYDDGFEIETVEYWNQGEPSWGVPAWEERGHPDLCGPFATYEQAMAVLRREREYLAYDGYRIAA